MDTHTSDQCLCWMVSKSKKKGGGTLLKAGCAYRMAYQSFKNGGLCVGGKKEKSVLSHLEGKRGEFENGFCLF